MAGGKETPRQKMIGMMYLVLTALLALQVSSAIMMKFKFLDDSLVEVNRKTVTANQQTISGISSKVNERKLASDLKVMETAEQVRARTAAMLKQIDDLRQTLIKNTGGTDETGMYVGAKEEELVAIHMIGGKRDGAAYKLKDDLNNYASFLKGAVPEVNMPAKLAFDGSEDPLAKNDREQKRKDFVGSPGTELEFAL